MRVFAGSLLMAVALGASPLARAGSIFKDDFDAPLETVEAPVAPQVEEASRKAVKKAEPSAVEVLSEAQQAQADQIRAWLNVAEGDPVATVNVPSAPVRGAKGTKAIKGAKPQPAQPVKTHPVNARLCVRQGLARLLAGVPSAAKGKLRPEAIALLEARVALMDNHPEAAVALLAPYEVPNAESATDERKEILVWLTAARLRQLVGKTGAPDGARSPGIPGDWLGVRVDAEADRPIFDVPEKPVRPGAAPSGKAPRGEEPEPMAKQLQRLRDAADILGSSTAGAAQARAKMVAADILGLQGSWSEAASAYGVVCALIQQAQAVKPSSDHTYETSETSVKNDVPAGWMAEAKAKQARAARLAECGQYGTEFIAYREGHRQMLAGRLADAVASFDGLSAMAGKKRQVSHDRVVAGALKDAKPGLSTKERKALTDKAEADWRMEAAKSGILESPFEAAAVVYAAQCRLALGLPKERTAALLALEKFIAQDAAGLFRGEALRTLARDAMEQDDLKTADVHWAKLDTWIAAIRKGQAADGADAAEPMPGIRQAAAPLTAPAATPFGQPNYWGKVARNAIVPGQLVCERNCPWYLDELEGETVRALGFLRFAQNKPGEAKTLWARLAQVDPLCGGGDDLGKNPNDRTRLLFAADHKRMLAYPDEAKLFDASPSVKWRVLRGEFLYCTQKFSEAAEVFAGMLPADKKLQTGGRAPRPAALTPAQRQYILLVLGMARLRAGDRPGAASAWEAAAGVRTLTGQRAAYAYAATVGVTGTPEQQGRGTAFLEKLAGQGGADEFVCKAKLMLALRKARENKRAEAEKLLMSIPEKAGPSHAMARHMLRHGGHLSDPDE